MIRNGFGTYPLAGWYAKDFAEALPGVPPTPPLFQFLLSSPPAAVMARVTGVRTSTGLAVASLCIVVATLATTWWVIRKRNGSLAAAATVVLFVGLPISTVLQGWLGSYDAFTFAFATMLVLSKRAGWALLLGCGLAVSAAEQGAVILIALAILAMARVGGNLALYGWAALGLVVGRIGLGIWLATNEVEHGRRYWLESFGVQYFVDLAKQSPLMLLASLFGAGLVMAAAAITTDRGRPVVASVVAVMVAVPATVLTEDQTRVFALLTWPPLLVMVLAAVATSPDVIRRWGRVTLLFALVIPGFFVWKGTAHVATHHLLHFVG
jgi:hypothetical protein